MIARGGLPEGDVPGGPGVGVPRGASTFGSVRLATGRSGWDSVRRARVGASIASSYRERPQTPDDDDLALAIAMAMTEAEPW